MDVEYIPIKSTKATKVWFELSVDQIRGIVSITKASHKGKRLAKVEGKTFPYPRAEIEQLDLPSKARQTWYIMCDLDGNIKVVPEEKVGGEWLAHLGFIYPQIGKIRLLRFEEE